MNFIPSYLPCESSKHSNHSVFDDLEDYIRTSKNQDKYTIILEDFNVQTGKLEDCVDFLCMEWTAPKRCNRDSMINTNGRASIDVCKNTDVCRQWSNR